MIEKFRDESGMTLIELVITMMIMSIAYLAILGGMTTAIIASSLHRQQATAQTVLRSYAEAVKGMPYVDCAPGYVHEDFDSPPDTPPDPYLRGFVPVIPSTVEYWRTTSRSGDTGRFYPNCTAPDTGIQKVKITIRSVDGKVNESLELVKREKLTGDEP